MSFVSLGNFIDLLHDHRLLGPQPMNAVREQLAPCYGDARSLAKYLVQRGWLTIYQVNQIFQERAQDLVIGPCRILDRLGEGAISNVYKAWHTTQETVVALKMLRPEFLQNRDAARQFSREIEAMTRLAHPNIVRAIDVGQIDRRRYLAMEFIEGTDLERFVQLSGPLPVGQACEYVRQAALGLQHTHERGLVHRDIKPANLLLQARPPEETSKRTGDSPALRPPGAPLVKIFDWGLARLGTPTYPTVTGQAGTQPGVLIGTADYLSPEQARNPRNVDIRSDIYSLGCTFYFFLTGQPPYPGNSLMQKLVQHEDSEPTPVAKFRRDVPNSLVNLLAKMLAKKSQERPPIPLSIAVTLAPYCRTGRSSLPRVVAR